MDWCDVGKVTFLGQKWIKKWHPRTLDIWWYQNEMLKVKAVCGVCAMFTVAAEKCHDVEKVVGEKEKVKEEKEMVH